MAEPKKFNCEAIRADFPILKQTVNGHPLVYLDNAATTQKPNAVIDAISHYYRSYNSNVHRGAHALADQATEAFEASRTSMAQFINSPKREHIIWTRGTTEGMNIIARAWGEANLKAGDKILVSHLEHHANIVPWQMVAKKVGATVEPIAITPEGEIDIAAFKAQLDSSVKCVSFGQVSNALGTVHPLDELIPLAKAVGSLVIVDGAQAVGHFEIDVQALGCDFYVFSGHKMFGPTGVGVLWGKEALLESMPPFLGGGEMIETVSFSGTTFNVLPYKFEAGTPDIAGVIGLGAAVSYLNSIDRKAAYEHEHALLEYTWEKAANFDGLIRVGQPKVCAGVFSFLLEGTHPSDVGMIIDQQGVAVRTGHHCTQPLMSEFGLPGTVRASFSFYNTKDDVDRLFGALNKAKTFLL